MAFFIKSNPFCSKMPKMMEKSHFSPSGPPVCPPWGRHKKMEKFEKWSKSCMDISSISQRWLFGLLCGLSGLSYSKCTKNGYFALFLLFSIVKRAQNKQPVCYPPCTPFRRLILCMGLPIGILELWLQSLR